MANDVIVYDPKIKGYFYNAHLNEQDQYDRLYNDEDFCRYLKELIGNGVFPTPSTQLSVVATNTMNIKVMAGQAWIEGRKISVDDDFTIEVPSADPVLDRIDRVVIRSNGTQDARRAEIVIKYGSPSLEPVAPDVVREDDIYELSLATVRVPKGVEMITSAHITDTRPDSEVCGWVAGLIQQIDISSLYNQWAAAYRSLYTMMEEWQEKMQSQFDIWFYDLTSSLTVGAYIRSFHKVVEGGPTVSNVIPLDMDGYFYDQNDVYIANLNGLVLTKNIDYILSFNGNVPTITLDGDLSEGNTFEIIILKSSLSQTSGGVSRRAVGEKFINCTDCSPEQVKGFVLNTLGESNEVAVTNRNFITYSEFEDVTTVNEVTFIKESNNIIVNGTSIAADTYISQEIDKNAFQPNTAYTINSGKTSGNAAVWITLTYSDNSTATYTSTNSAATFTTSSSLLVTSAIVYIGTASASVTMDEEILKPQIEYGYSATDYVPGVKETFVYNGTYRPTFTDVVNNVWVNDDDAGDILVVYVEQAQPIPREKELMYYWDYAGVTSTTSANEIHDKIHNKVTDVYYDALAYPGQGLYIENNSQGLAYHNIFDSGMIAEIEFGDTTFGSAGDIWSLIGNSSCALDNRGIVWRPIESCWGWGSSWNDGRYLLKLFPTLTDPRVFKNSKLTLKRKTRYDIDIYINDVYVDNVNVSTTDPSSHISFGSTSNNYNGRSYAPIYIKSLKIWG